MSQPGKRARSPSRLHEAYDFVVFHEKHGNSYFSLGPPGTRHESFKKICLAVAKSRLREGWYGYDHDQPPTMPERPPDVNPNSPLQEQAKALRTLERWEQRYAHHEKDVYNHKLIQRVADGDKDAALELIASRAQHEYEGFDFESFTDPDKF